MVRTVGREGSVAYIVVKATVRWLTGNVPSVNSLLHFPFRFEEARSVFWFSLSLWPSRLAMRQVLQADH